ncbi:MAG: hypothetical protein WDO18_22010 [Acidobacteriota bacterium]
MRSEAEVFADLGELCRSEGYVHTLAFLCFQNNIVRYSGTLKADDLLPLFSFERLIRTEIVTLVGLMVQGDIAGTIPSPSVLGEQVSRTHLLLKELQETFLVGMPDALVGQAEHKMPDLKYLQSGEFLREPIFYGGESAYSFQYRDLARRKYAADDPWLKEKKGFTIDDASKVVESITRFLEHNLRVVLGGLASLPPEEWSLLPAFAFTVDSITKESGLYEETVVAVLEAFALPPNEKNAGFRVLDDFNVANATPLLKADGQFYLFHSYSLAEAIYDSPFFWMAADSAYFSVAATNRGLYAEEFCTQRLELVLARSVSLPT